MQIILKTTTNHRILFENSQAFIQALRQSGQFLYVEPSLSYNAPQVVVDIDREKAATFGITMADISSAMTGTIGGNQLDYFSYLNQRLKVIPQAPQNLRDSISTLATIPMRTLQGDVIPLSNLIRTRTVIAPLNLEQFQQLNSSTISLIPLPHVTAGQVLALVSQIAKQSLDNDILIDTIGSLRQFEQERSSLTQTFFLSILLIYLLLAAQYESFRDPIIILLSVPLSISGGLLPMYFAPWLSNVLTLKFNSATLNIFTQIGLITLIGLITKAGILIVSFANQLQDEGLSITEAAVQGASIRLKPILMTTSAMVLGAAPLIFASGAGAQSRFAIGLVIVSGMLIGTILTLLILPVLYTLIANDRQGRLKEHKT